MKRILYFLGLKVLEIGGVVGYFFMTRSMFRDILASGPKEIVAPYDSVDPFTAGLVTVVTQLFFVGIIIGISALIKWNWQKAGELAGRER